MDFVEQVFVQQKFSPTDKGITNMKAYNHLFDHFDQELLVLRMWYEQLVPHLNERGAHILQTLLSDGFVFSTDLVKYPRQCALGVHQENG